jgi:hypothetical protein
MTDSESANTTARHTGDAPLGTERDVWWTLLLIIVTLGIYGLWWFYVSHREMREFSGSGLGGWPALIFAIIPVVGIILWFTMPTEVSRLFEGEGNLSPVRTLTGLWALIPIIGGMIWFYKVQTGLNTFWASKTRDLVETLDKQ